MIYSSANGVASVEDDWFGRSVEGRIAGVNARPPPHGTMTSEDVERWTTAEK